jgi:hypothetical protein
MSSLQRGRSRALTLEGMVLNILGEDEFQGSRDPPSPTEVDWLSHCRPPHTPTQIPVRSFPSGGISTYWALDPLSLTCTGFMQRSKRAWSRDCCKYFICQMAFVWCACFCFAKMVSGRLTRTVGADVSRLGSLPIHSQRLFCWWPRSGEMQCTRLGSTYEAYIYDLS